MFSPCCSEPLEEMADDKWECSDCGRVYTEDELADYMNNDYPDEEEA